MRSQPTKHSFFILFTLRVPALPSEKIFKDKKRDFAAPIVALELLPSKRSFDPVF